MRTRTGKASEIKVGKFVMIDGEPWEVVSVKKGASIIGKEKITAEAVGFVTGEKKVIEAYADESMEFPILEVKPAQVLSIGLEKITMLDLRNRSVFTISVSEAANVRKNLRTNAEVDYAEIAGRKRILNVGLYDAHSYT